MAVTWITVTTQTGSSWVSVTQAVDDWLDPRLTHLLAEDGAFLIAEDDSFLATEAQAATSGASWVPL